MDVGKQSDEPKTMDTNEKYCFQLDHQDSVVKRFDLSTGEVKVLTQGIEDIENLNIYSMKVIQTKNHPDGLCVIATGVHGVHFFDCETLENYFTHEVYNDGDSHLQIQFLKNVDLLFIGSQRGNLDLVDVSKLKNHDNNIGMHYAVLDAGVSALEVSPDERYLCIGTEKGTVHIYKKKYIEQRKPYKYL